MKKEYWLNKWESNDIAFHEENVNPYLIDYINDLNLREGDSIFVPLCGKTKDMIWLADNRFQVIGVELSPVACRDFFTELNITPHITKQNKFIKYQHENIQLLCGDFFDLTRNDLADAHAIYDSKALIALPSDIRKRYVNHIVSCLGTKIKILLITRETNCKISPPPFPVSEEEVNDLYGTHFNVKLLNRLAVIAIPERLIKKGYKDMTESVYLISEKN